MLLTIQASELETVFGAQHEVVLGIILQSGVVRVRIADVRNAPGHAEWIAQESITDAWRGFSILVKGGNVYRLFAASRLNPGPDGLLEEDIIRQLEQLLPRAKDYDVLRF